MSELETIVQESTEVVLHTGEIIHLDDLAACARAVEEIRDLEYRLRMLKQDLTRPFVAESEKRGSKTITLGTDLEVVVGTNRTVKWDVEALQELLEVGLPQERFDDLVKVEVTYKVSAREADRIAGANDHYAEIVESAKTYEPKQPSLSISRGKS